MKPIRRILYATDFSPASRRAFATALALARSLHARLTIASVLAPIVTVPEQYLDPATIEFEGLDAAARDFLAGMTDRYAVSLFEEMFVPRSWSV